MAPPTSWIDRANQRIAAGGGVASDIGSRASRRGSRRASDQRNTERYKKAAQDARAKREDALAEVTRELEYLDELMGKPSAGLSTRVLGGSVEALAPTNLLRPGPSGHYGKGPLLAREQEDQANRTLRERWDVAKRLHDQLSVPSPEEKQLEAIVKGIPTFTGADPYRDPGEERDEPEYKPVYGPGGIGLYSNPWERLGADDPETRQALVEAEYSILQRENFQLPGVVQAETGQGRTTLGRSEIRAQAEEIAKEKYLASTSPTVETDRPSASFAAQFKAAQEPVDPDAPDLFVGARGVVEDFSPAARAKVLAEHGVVSQIAEPPRAIYGRPLSQEERAGLMDPGSAYQRTAGTSPEHRFFEWMRGTVGGAIDLFGSDARQKLVDRLPEEAKFLVAEGLLSGHPGPGGRQLPGVSPTVQPGLQDAQAYLDDKRSLGEGRLTAFEEQLAQVVAREEAGLPELPASIFEGPGLETVVPRQTSGRSDVTTVMGQKVVIDFDKPIRTGGAPGRWYWAEPVDKKKPGFYTQLEKAYQLGKWEDAPGSKAALGIYAARATRDPRALQRELANEWWSEPEVGREIFAAAYGLGRALDDQKKTGRPAPTLDQSWSRLTNTLRGLNTHHQETDATIPPTWLGSEELMRERRKRLNAVNLNYYAPGHPLHVNRKTQSGLRRMGDLFLSLAKGVVGVPEAAIGISGIAVGDQLPQWMAKLGFTLGETQEMLDSWYSTAFKEARMNTQEADGFLDTFVAALMNPSVPINVTLESLPLMFAGWGAGGAAVRGLSLGARSIKGLARGTTLVGRAASQVTPRLGNWAAQTNKWSNLERARRFGAGGQFGEGLISAGSMAENIRQESPEGRLTSNQRLLSGAAGLFTGLIAKFGAWAAGKMGVTDIDTFMTQNWSRAQMKDLNTRVLRAAFQEGVLEELPQSVQEQVLQNFATGRPWTEGLDDASVMGMLAGMLTGGTVQGYMQLVQKGADAETIKGYVEQMQRNAGNQNFQREYVRLAGIVGGNKQVKQTREDLVEAAKGDLEAMRRLEQLWPSQSRTYFNAGTPTEVEAFTRRDVGQGSLPIAVKGESLRAGMLDSLDATVSEGGRVLVEASEGEGYARGLKGAARLLNTAHRSRNGNPSNITVEMPATPEGQRQHAEALNKLRGQGATLILPVTVPIPVVEGPPAPSVMEQVKAGVAQFGEDVVIGISGEGVTTSAVPEPIVETGKRRGSAFTQTHRVQSGAYTNTKAAAEGLAEVSEAYPALTRVHISGLGDVNVRDHLIKQIDVASQEHFTFTSDSNPRVQSSEYARRRAETPVTKAERELGREEAVARAAIAEQEEFQDIAKTIGEQADDFRAAGVSKATLDRLTTATTPGEQRDALAQFVEEVDLSTRSLEEVLENPAAVRAIQAFSWRHEFDPTALSVEELTAHPGLAELAKSYGVRNLPEATEEWLTTKVRTRIATQVRELAQEAKLLEDASGQPLSVARVAERPHRSLAQAAGSVGIITRGKSRTQLAEALLAWRREVGVAGTRAARTIHKTLVEQREALARRGVKEVAPEKATATYPDVRAKPRGSEQQLLVNLAAQILERDVTRALPVEDQKRYDAVIQQFDRQLAKVQAEGELSTAGVTKVNEVLAHLNRPLLEVTPPVGEPTVAPKAEVGVKPEAPEAPKKPEAPKTPVEQAWAKVEEVQGAAQQVVSDPRQYLKTEEIPKDQQERLVFSPDDPNSRVLRWVQQAWTAERQRRLPHAEGLKKSWRSWLHTATQSEVTRLLKAYMPVSEAIASLGLTPSEVAQVAKVPGASITPTQRTVVDPVEMTEQGLPIATVYGDTLAARIGDAGEIIWTKGYDTKHIKKNWNTATSTEATDDARNTAQNYLMALALRAPKAIVDTMGIGPAEVLSNLMAWSQPKGKGGRRYTAWGRKTQAKINKGVEPKFRWTGLYNMMVLAHKGENMKWQDVAPLFKAVRFTDDPNKTLEDALKSSAGLAMRRHIQRTLFGLDARFDYSDLTLEIGTIGDPIKAEYVREEGGEVVKTIRINFSKDLMPDPRPFAHEVGHHWLWRWADELLGDGQTPLRTGGLLGLTNQQISGAHASKARIQWALGVKQFSQSLMDSADLRTAYGQDPAEVFARFTDWFVNESERRTGGPLPTYLVKDVEDRPAPMAGDPKDRFTVKQFEAFARLMQEKMYVDALDGNVEFRPVEYFDEDLATQNPDLFNLAVEIAASVMVRNTEVPLPKKKGRPQTYRYDPITTRQEWEDAFRKFLREPLSSERVDGLGIHDSLISPRVINRFLSPKLLTVLFEAAQYVTHPIREELMGKRQKRSPIGVAVEGEEEVYTISPHLLTDKKGTSSATERSDLASLTRTDMKGDEEQTRRKQLSDIARKMRAQWSLDWDALEASGKLTDEQVLEEIVKVATGNLKHLANAFPEEYRQRAMRWYDGAHKLAGWMARNFDVTVEQASGVLASLSPQAEWDGNVTAAYRVIALTKEFESKRLNKSFTTKRWETYMAQQRAQAETNRKNALKKGKTEEEAQQGYDETLAEKLAHKEKWLGKTWHQLPALGQAGLLRAYEREASPFRAHRTNKRFLRLYASMTPEGHVSGDFSRAVTSRGAQGNEQNFGWPQSDGEILKAIEIVKNPSQSNIDYQLGEGTKVRNFYNNIVNPSSANWLTADTHAVAATHFQPFAQSAPEVQLAQGGAASVSVVTGVRGSYPVESEAYFRAAEELTREWREDGTIGPNEVILPRQLQSLTWTAARVLFPQAEKSGRGQSKVNPAVVGTFGKVLGEDLQFLNDDVAAKTLERVRALLDKGQRSETEDRMPTERIGSRAIWALHGRGGPNALTVEEVREAIELDSGGYRQVAWANTPEQPLSMEVGESGEQVGLGGISTYGRQIPFAEAGVPTTLRDLEVTTRGREGLVAADLLSRLRNRTRGQRERPGEYRIPAGFLQSAIKPYMNILARELLNLTTPQASRLYGVPVDFYSQALEVARTQLPKGRFRASDGLKIFEHRGKDGRIQLHHNVKESEMLWLGLRTFFGEVAATPQALLDRGWTTENVAEWQRQYPNGTLTRQDVVDYVGGHNLVFREVVRGTPWKSQEINVEEVLEEIDEDTSHRDSLIKELEAKTPRTTLEEHRLRGLKTIKKRVKGYATTKLGRIQEVEDGWGLTRKKIIADLEFLLAAEAWALKEAESPQLAGDAAVLEEGPRRDDAIRDLNRVVPGMGPFLPSLESIRDSHLYIQAHPFPDKDPWLVRLSRWEEQANTDFASQAAETGAWPRIASLGMLNNLLALERLGSTRFLKSATEELRSRGLPLAGLDGWPSASSIIEAWIENALLPSTSVALLNKTADQREVRYRESIGLTQEWLEKNQVTKFSYGPAALGNLTPQDVAILTMMATERGRRALAPKGSTTTPDYETTVESLSTEGQAALREAGDHLEEAKRRIRASLKPVVDAAVRVEEVGTQMQREGVEDHLRDAPYSEYSIPGGTNYREVALVWEPTDPTQQFPTAKHGFPSATILHYRAWDRVLPVYTPEQVADINLRIRTVAASTSMLGRRTDLPEVKEKIARDLAVEQGVITPLEAAWWNHANRIEGDTTGATTTMLFVEELQSDWIQSGRDILKAATRNAVRLALPTVLTKHPAVSHHFDEELGPGEVRVGPLIFTAAGAKVFDAVQRDKMVKTVEANMRTPHYRKIQDDPRPRMRDSAEAIAFGIPRFEHMAGEYLPGGLKPLHTGIKVINEGFDMPARERASYEKRLAEARHQESQADPNAPQRVARIEAEYAPYQALAELAGTVRTSTEGGTTAQLPPDVPFKQQWSLRGLKQIIHRAAEQGYDSVGFPQGLYQEQRYGHDQYFPDQMRWREAEGAVRRVDINFQMPRLKEAIADIQPLPIRLAVNEDNMIVGAETTPKQVPSRGTDVRVVREQKETGAVLKAMLLGRSLKEVVGPRLMNRFIQEGDGVARFDEGVVFGGSGLGLFYDKMLMSRINDWLSQSEFQEEGVTKADIRKAGGLIQTASFREDQLGDIGQEGAQVLRLGVSTTRGRRRAGEAWQGRGALPEEVTHYYGDAAPEGTMIPPVMYHYVNVTPQMRDTVTQKGLPQHYPITLTEGQIAAVAEILDASLEETRTRLTEAGYVLPEVEDFSDPKTRYAGDVDAMYDAPMAEEEERVAKKVAQSLAAGEPPVEAEGVEAASEGEPAPPETVAPVDQTVPPQDLIPGGPEHTEEEIAEVSSNEPPETPLLSLPEIEQLLTKVLKVPIRVGGYAGGARGIYKEDTQVVATRKRHDIDEILRQVGNHIARRVLRIGRHPKTGALDHRAPWSEELVDLGRRTMPPGYSAKDWYLRQQGESEFFKLWATDRAAARELAPNYFKAFTEAVGRHELSEGLTTVQRELHRYYEANGAERFRQFVDFGGLKADTPEDWLEVFETQMIQGLAPLKRAVQGMEALRTGVKYGRYKRMLTEEGLPDSIEDDAFRLAEQAKGSTMKAFVALESGVRDDKGDVRNNGASVLKALNAAVEGVKRADVAQTVEDFAIYLVARHVPETRARAKAAKEEWRGPNARDAKAFVRMYESPQFKKAADQIDLFQSGLLDYAVEKGLIDQASVDRMKAAYDYYVPMNRVMDIMEANAVGAMQASGWQWFKRKAAGSGRLIINPLETIVKNTHKMITEIDKNTAYEAFVRQAEEVAAETMEKQGVSGVGQWIEPVPTPKELARVPAKRIEEQVRRMADEQGTPIPKELNFAGMLDYFTESEFSAPNGKNYIRVMRKGKAHWYRINQPVLFEAMTGWGQQAPDMLGTLLIKPAALLRTAATMTFEFMARNPGRDTLEAYMLSRYGFKPVLDTARGLFHVAKKTEEYEKFLWFGAGGRTNVSMDRDMVQTHLNRMTEGDRQAFVASVASHPMDMMRGLSEVLENASRMGEFLKGVKKEGATPAGYLAAAYSAAEVTINFRRAGRTAQKINQYSAFFNAGVQGKVRMAEGFARNPLQFLMRGTMLSALSAVSWFINHDDEEWREKLHKVWEVDAYWLFPLGVGKGHDWLRIPKPWDMGIIFGNSVEASLDYLYGLEDGPQTLKHMFGDLETRAYETLASLAPTGLLPIAEAWANKSVFRRGPIVPPHKTGLPAELQATRYTTQTARRLAKLFRLMGTPIAAAKIDNFASGLIAGWWTFGTDWIADPLIYKTQEVLGIEAPAPRAKTLADWPLVKAFVSAPSYRVGAASVTQLYEDMKALDDFNLEKRTLDRLIRLGHASKVEELKALERRPENLRLASMGNQLPNTYEAVAELSAMIADVDDRLDFTPEEQTEWANYLLMYMFDTARVLYQRPRVYTGTGEQSHRRRVWEDYYEGTEPKGSQGLYLPTLPKDPVEPGPVQGWIDKVLSGNIEARRRERAREPLTYAQAWWWSTDELKDRIRRGARPPARGSRER